MAPPIGGLNLDLEALSGICGSISIACWIVVFTPQILENFRRGSASGLSLLFIIVWLLGDVFNIIGAVLQGVLPTMTILAVYYTFADLVLLGQCIYYRGWRLSDLLKEDSAVGAEQTVDEDDDEEETPLLSRQDPPTPPRRLTPADADRRRPSTGSLGSFQGHLRSVDGTHLSPATPLLASKKATDIPQSHTLKQSSPLMAILYNTSAILLVCAAGVLGWWLSSRSTRPQYPDHDHRHNRHHTAPQIQNEAIHFDIIGQVFGYLCAVFYLGSRIPQLLLNYRRKSTEGVSILFFLFACVGNLTYVLSIFAYEPSCARIASFNPHETSRGSCESGEWGSEYGRYVLVNTSWLIGSAGTLLLDLLIFGQFWIYRGRKAGEDV